MEQSLGMGLADPRDLSRAGPSPSKPTRSSAFPKPYTVYVTRCKAVKDLQEWVDEPTLWRKDL